MEKCLVALILCCLCSQIESQSATDALNLKTDLFTTNAYDSKIRPVSDQSQPIYCYVEFYLLAINGLDEVTETLKTTGYLRLYWLDEFLDWTPSSYGGIEYSFYPQNDVWKPDVALKNSFLKYEQLGDKALLLEVASSGVVSWSPFQVFQSTCSIDITFFPYDKQTCSLKFVAWSYTKNEVLMEGGTGGIVLDEYEKNSAWDILTSRWYTMEEKEEATIVFEFTIQRKPLYNLLTLVFPVIMLAVLNLFVFALPSNGGEKAGYAVTVFLAFAVFLTIMEASFPQNSDTVAYFAIYVVMETVQSTLITIVALLMIRVASFDDDTKIPKIVIALARFSKCKALREKFNTKKVQPQINIIEVKPEELEIKTGKQALEKCEDSGAELESEWTWVSIANALDVLFFVFFLLAFVVATVVCILLAKNNA